MQERPAQWRWVFGSLALASILTWDSFVAFEMFMHDLDVASVVLVVASSGLRASAIHSLSPDLRILRVYSMATRVPTLAVLLVLGGGIGHILFFLLTLQTLYGLLLGRQLNREFWQSIITNETLERRTEALRDNSRGLENANSALKEEIVARKRVEVELRLAQKLEAVGRLAAGIAHEINTPLQSVTGSVYFASQSVKDLLGLVDAYRSAHRARGETSSPDEIDARLTTAEIAADLPFLLDNLPQSLELAQEGLSRVATIVHSIKEFAHPDAAEMKRIDLNRAVETTLAIARNEYTSVAEVETDLGELPLVNCHGGELNQVLLNLIVNAAHTIEDAVRHTSKKGRITIRTHRAGDYAVVSVSDTGAGIPLDIRNRVFDPFFTTKEVGKGTGQGLAIARSVIVKRHGGEISFETELGRGTTFLVKVPIRSPPPGAAVVASLASTE
jgi:signal transduction histidine kinase